MIPALNRKRMAAARIVAAALLALFVGVPVALPLVECLSRGDPLWLWSEAEHLGKLTANTLLLVAGTLALSLPVGTLLAVLLFRTDLPWRRFWIGAALLVLFVPLPMVMSAWYAVLGRDGWLPRPGWDDSQGGRGLNVGLLPAVWVHAQAGIPWVLLIVGNGLCWIEKELEEDALLHAGPWRVLWRVTLPRCRGSLAAAGLWLALSVFAEIGVTYFLQVSTLAEEVQTQFASGSSSDVALARSVLLSLPFTLGLTGLLLWQAPRLERALPPLQGWLQPPRPFSLGAGRWPCTLLLTAAATLLLLFPLGSLVWKVGLAGSPRSWSLFEAWTRLVTESRIVTLQVLASLLIAALTGALTASAALVCCRLAQGSRWFGGFLLMLLALTWSLPGPVIGIGLLELIMHVPRGTLEMLLYRHSSPLPVMWAQFVRFLPAATALLWPWVRTVPRELIEAARLEGAGPLQELVRVTWPMTARGFGWTTLVLAALCLGEVAASNHVQTPGWNTFVNVLMDRMHYGVGSAVAALCLILLAWLVVLIAGAALVSRN